MIKKIGVRIERLRLQKGLTRAQLGKLLNMSLSTIWNLENGYAALQWSQICMLAAFFNMTCEDLLCDEEDDESPNFREKVVLISKSEHYKRLIQQLEARITSIEERLKLD